MNCLDNDFYDILLLKLFPGVTQDSKQSIINITIIRHRSTLLQTEVWDLTFQTAMWNNVKCQK